MYNIECETNDYGLTSATKKYAKLFKVPITIKGENNYNDIQIVFRIYNISSTSGLKQPKEYLLTVTKDNTNIINLFDLNPDIDGGIDLGYIIEGNDLNIYCKGSVIGARLKLQVVYCTCIGMFTFFNCSNFTNDIIITQPRNFLIRNELTFLNNWQKNTYYPSFVTKKNSLVTVNINMNNGTKTDGTVICEGLPVPMNTIHIPCVDSDGLCGVLTLRTDGKLYVKLIQNANKDIMTSFSYYSNY